MCGEEDVIKSPANHGSRKCYPQQLEVKPWLSCSINLKEKFKSSKYINITKNSKNPFSKFWVEYRKGELNNLILTKKMTNIDISFNYNTIKYLVQYFLVNHIVYLNK